MLKLSKGRGSSGNKGGESTTHWISQRVTSILLIPLSILFVFNFVRVIDKPFAEVILTFQHPFNNLVAVLFLLISLWHYRQGVEVVAEDYVHDLRIRNFTLRIVGIICWILAIVVIYSFINIYIREV
tara:strand:+ start:1586 stop:1966 length:381 start_codon:yes stop_codon:yes gene_type:complete